MLIFFLFVGVVISIVYTPLSGGNPEHFVLVMFSGPLVALGVLIAWMFYRNERRERARNKENGVWDIRSWFSRHGWGVFFWSFVVWTSLPILFNLGSHLARWMEYPEIGDLLFAFRYSSFFLSGGGALLLAILVGYAAERIAAFRAFRMKESERRRKHRAVSS